MHLLRSDHLPAPVANIKHSQNAWKAEASPDKLSKRWSNCLDKDAAHNFSKKNPNHPNICHPKTCLHMIRREARTYTRHGMSRTSSTKPKKSMKQMHASAALYSVSHCTHTHTTLNLNHKFRTTLTFTNINKNLFVT